MGCKLTYLPYLCPDGTHDLYHIGQKQIFALEEGTISIFQGSLPYEHPCERSERKGA